MITRRSLLALLACSAGPTFGFAQGISSRNIKPQPRGKPSGRPFHARFTDVATQAGLTRPIIYGGLDTKRYIVEVVGCGVAFLDYDNDGWLDVFLVDGGSLADPKVAGTARDRLYRNRRDGTFEDVTAASRITHQGFGVGACAGDFDNDGWTDLYLTREGSNTLYKNGERGTFRSRDGGYHA